MKNTRLTLRARLRLAAVAALLLPAALTATPVMAHDNLSSTTPAQDAVLTAAPDTVSLTLSEPPLDSAQLNTSILTVTDGAGKTVSEAKPTVYGPVLSTKISAGEPGTYTVLWRAVSSDGHPIDGKYTFTVRPATAAQSASAAPATQTPSAASPATTTPGTAAGAAPSVPPPNNSNAPLTLGIAAAVLAAAIALTLFLRNRRKNTGA